MEIAIFRSRKEQPVSVVRRYISALNTGDPGNLEELLAEDCRLVDSTGGWLEGRDNALSALRVFFSSETDFRIDAETIVLRGDEVLVRGRAEARDPRLAKDTLWRVRVEAGKVAFWQSYGAVDLPLARMLLPEKVGISFDPDAAAATSGP